MNGPPGSQPAGRLRLGPVAGRPHGSQPAGRLAVRKTRNTNHRQAAG